MDKLTIYLVDDHKLFREGLKLLLSTQDFVRHIYEASNGREFIENLSFVDCDVVLMDIEMPEMNGIDATIEAMKMKPNLKIIVLSMYGDEQYYYKMIDAGAKGFLLKNSGIDKVVTAIQKVAVVFSSGVVRPTRQPRTRQAPFKAPQRQPEPATPPPRTDTMRSVSGGSFKSRQSLQTLTTVSAQLFPACWYCAANSLTFSIIRPP